jgi:hypothetical protein
VTNAPTHTPPISESNALAILVAIMGLADVWLIVWLLGSIWGVAVAAGTIVGLMIAITWQTRRHLPGASIVLLLLSGGLAVALERASPSAAIGGAIVAFGIFGFWLLAEFLSRGMPRARKSGLTRARGRLQHVRRR